MVLPSSGPISLSQVAVEFGGAQPHAMNEYYTNSAAKYTTGVTGIPASGSPFPMSALRGKAATLYTLQHPDTGGYVYYDPTQGFLRITTPGATSSLFQFSMWNDPSVYLNASSHVAFLLNNNTSQATQVSNYFGGTNYYLKSAIPFQTNNSEFAFRVHYAPSANPTSPYGTGGYFIEVFGAEQYFLSYDTGLDLISANFGSGIPWKISPVGGGTGPVVLGTQY